MLLFHKKYLFIICVLHVWYLQIFEQYCPIYEYLNNTCLVFVYKVKLQIVTIAGFNRNIVHITNICIFVCLSNISLIIFEIGVKLQIVTIARSHRNIVHTLAVKVRLDQTRQIIKY